MSLLLRCSECGKLMPKPADTDRVMCSACGAWLTVPEIPAAGMNAPAPGGSLAAATSESAAAPRAKVTTFGRGTVWATVAASVAVLLVAAAAAVLILPRGRRAGDDEQYWAIHREQIITLKNDAEDLAIAGDLAAAHAKYREIEKIAAGRKITDTALWDLTERAKFDQDRIYSLILTAKEAEFQGVAGPTRAGAARVDAGADGNDAAPATSAAVVTGNAPPTRQYPAAFDVMKMLGNVAERVAPPTTAAASSAHAPGTSTRPPADREQVAMGSQQQPQGDRQGPAAAAVPATRPAGAGTVLIDPFAVPSSTARTTAATSTTAPAGAPTFVHAGGAVTDEQIGQALQRGVEFLLRNMKGDQIALDHASATHAEAVNTLVVYSLLHASRAMREERLNVSGPLMKGLLGRVKEHLYLVEQGEPPTPVTYGRSLRAAALAVYDRNEDRKALEEDVKWLVAAASDGAYTYNDQTGREFDRGARWTEPAAGNEGRDVLHFIEPDGKGGNTLLHNGERLVPQPPRGGGPPKSSTMGGDAWRRRMAERYRSKPGGGYTGSGVLALPYRELPTAVWDNSNAQYGLLGIWAGAEVGIEVPFDYWLAVEKHWMNNQLQTGQWNYNGDGSNGYYGMTIAGIASLLVTHDYLDAPALGAETGREPFSPHLAYAMMWLEKGDNCLRVSDPPLYYLGYNLFGLERVGLASGFKYFGKHDWYRELAVKVVATQWPNGAWGREQEGVETFIDTAYMVLFLSRGRHPILMNKLRFDGYWNNRSRDVANLSRFASRELERAINWQIVPIDREWHEWLDSPVLFIASHQPPKSVTDEEYAKLRKFVDGGGLLFTHADAGSQKFNAFAEELTKKLFPEHGTLANLPQDHELYGLQYKMKTKPALKYVTNGSRILMLHSPTDLTTAWQVRNGTKREMWELAVNIFVYAAGKSDLRNRLSSPYVPEPAGAARSTVRVARVRHGANWDPEPYAWPRFARVMRRDTGVAVEAGAEDAKELNAQTTPVAHLTGTAAVALDDAQLTAIKNFVESGGILFVDACGGSEAFTQSAHAAMGQAFPNAKLAPMTDNHPLLKGGANGMTDLSKPQLRPYAESKVGKTLRLEMLSAGKGHVVFSPLDVTTGLLGTNTWAVVGYQPDYAQNLVKNLVLWAAAPRN